MKKYLAALLCAVLCLPLLTSCGEDAEPISRQQGQALSDTSDPDAVPQQGGSITIYSPKPDSFCPIRTQNTQVISMLNLIFDSLILNSSDLTPIPSLATEWHVSDDGLQWNIRLRSDVYWHDGSRFTAADAVYTINQIRTDKENYYRKNVESIKKVTAAGQNEMQVQLQMPQSNFISLLYFPIIKSQPGAVDKDSFAVTGTGPFCFEDRGEVNSYYLTRNEDWWKGSAYLDTIRVSILPDKDTALYSFSSGDIDLMPVDSVDLGTKVDTTNAEFLSYPTNRFHFLGFNHRRQIFRSKEVRQAISLAINRQLLISAIPNEGGRPTDVPLVRAGRCIPPARRGKVRAPTRQNSYWKKTAGRCQTESIKRR